MYIRLPEPVSCIDNESLLWLKSLNDKLLTNNHDYSDYKLSINEIKRILSLIDHEKGMCLRPMNTNWGFSVGFVVMHVTPAVNLKDSLAKGEDLLSFIEKQLPEQWRFHKLKSIFLKSNNIKLVTSTGLETPIDNYGKYDY